jgi:hypothetical protein
MKVTKLKTVGSARGDAKNDEARIINAEAMAFGIGH